MGDRIRYKDLTNQRFGKLIVLKPIGMNKRRLKIWECSCDCGRLKNILGSNLIRGTKSCGCLNHRKGKDNPTHKDLTGQKFGRLTAIKPVGIGKSNLIWECICECKKRKNVVSHSLVSGTTKSCGCLISDRRIKWITGEKHHELTFLYEVESRNKRRYGLFRCSCGNEKIICFEHVRGGNIKSCGCLQTAGINGKILWTTHGLSKALLYKVYRGIKTRCYNPNADNYYNYGGRGITICDEWKNDFKAFYDWAINAGYEKGLEIDRINNDDNYDPGNCRWLTHKANCQNMRKCKKAI